MRTKPTLYGDSSGEFATSTKPAGTAAGLARRIGVGLLHEFLEVLPPTIFFFLGFNLIVLTTNLLLAQYLVAFSSFMLATTAALIVGKAALVAKSCPFFAATIERR